MDINGAPAATGPGTPSWDPCGVSEANLVKGWPRRPSRGGTATFRGQDFLDTLITELYMRRSLEHRVEGA